MVKRFFHLVIISFLGLSLVVIAGGVEYPSTSGFYIEANGGYSFRNWQDDGLFQEYIIVAQDGDVLGHISNSQNGLTVGPDLGYQVNNYIALEAGWYYLPQIRYTVPGGNVVVAGNNFTVDSWLVYFGGKLRVPVYHQLYWFGKFAAAYISNSGNLTSGFSASVDSSIPTSGNFWAPLFATGFQYDITMNWSFNLQYLFVEGNNRTPFGGLPTTIASPDTNLFTIGVGYKFII